MNSISYQGFYFASLFSFGHIFDSGTSLSTDQVFQDLGIRTGLKNERHGFRSVNQVIIQIVVLDYSYYTLTSNVLFKSRLYLCIPNHCCSEHKILTSFPNHIILVIETLKYNQNIHNYQNMQNLSTVSSSIHITQ